MAAELIYKIYLFVRVGESRGKTDFTKDFKLRYDVPIMIHIMWPSNSKKFFLSNWSLAIF